MFHYDRGLKLTRADLAIDFTRRQKRAFISHAHSDHIARHEYAICTPATACLYRLRLGVRPVLELPYRQPIEWGGLRLTTWPAGHCLGSAMLLAEQEHESLLYTGDFKLGESATAERAELPRADVLVIESTYGDPRYRHRPRDEVVAELVAEVRAAIDRERTPVVYAYALGKGQEVTRLLTMHGIPVLQHPKVYAVSQVYEACGVSLGAHACYEKGPLPGHAVVVPPGVHHRGELPGLKQVVRIAVSGWAGSAAGDIQRRWGVDRAIPLSDHADYDELLAAVAKVSPRIVYCTHGPASFVDYLRAAGFEARLLGGP